MKNERDIFLGWGPIKNFFWDLPIKTINFGFQSSPISFVFKLATFGASLHFYGPFGFFSPLVGAIFVVGLRFKKRFLSLLI